MPDPLAAPLGNANPSNREESQAQGGGPTQVACARWAALDNWRTLVEVCPEPFHEGMSKVPPAIIIKQHRDTKELMIEVFDCEGGLDVTYTNGGVQDKERSKWFRDIQTCRKSLRALRVRFLARGEGANLRLNS